MSELLSEQWQVAAQLGEALKKKSGLLATAESCTGGLLAGAITAIAGSSQWFDRGFVTYTNEAKMDMLGVNLAALDNFGAVSQEVAIEMAEGTLNHAPLSTCAVSTTGIAGPDGGTEHKPVGLVCFAVSYRKADGIVTLPFSQNFVGDRHQVRVQAVIYAMEITRRIVEEN
ncbi:CinA family protein [Advenella sp. FME57]|uniref:CinA family protein n=1 Tax=Advenella sp. FME57 TaxID=2742604 RepID=UPI0018660343|nr:CinA family protein [Advenella sp. FME57]